MKREETVHIKSMQDSKPTHDTILTHDQISTNSSESIDPPGDVELLKEQDMLIKGYKSYWNIGNKKPNWTYV